MRSRTKKYTTHNIVDSIHTGNMLIDFYKARRIYKSARARKLGRTFKTLATYEKNATIQTTILWKICHALKQNFFWDITSKLPAECTTYALADMALQEKVTALEEELKTVKAERDIMVRLMGKDR